MFLSILRFLFIVLEVVLLFNLLIVVHELGHFLAAKWRGLVVEKFGIWFGKPLWKKTIGGVEYSLGSIPAGGFVALPQMAPMEALEGESTADRKELPRISALDKIIVAFAGPLFSFGLAIFFAVIVWIVGRPVSEAEGTQIVGYVHEGSPAQKAGILPGDKILKVDGHVVNRFGGMGSDSITWRVVRSEGATIPIEIERGGEVLTVNPTPIKPAHGALERKSLRQIQIEPAETPMVGKVLPNTAAATAGLKSNDVIVAVNGKKLLHPSNIMTAVSENPGAPISLTVQRGSAEVTVQYQPPSAKIAQVTEGGPAALAGVRMDDVVEAINDTPARNSWEATSIIRAKRGEPLRLAIRRDNAVQQITVTTEIPKGMDIPMIGVVWANEGIQWDAMGRAKLVHPSPFEQIRQSVMMIVDTVGALFSPKSDVSAQHLSGPVAIMRIYYMMFESDQGWRLALWFSVILNVNLALMNLLPFPVLDGGHITLALLEAVRRKPLNFRVLEFVQTGCAMLLIGYMLYVTFFDVGDLFKRDKVRFESKTETKR